MALELGYREALDGLRSHVAIVDRSGCIVAVNEPWRRFAEENGYAGDEGAGVGMRYADACRSDPIDTVGLAVADALDEVLAGRAQSYETEYPCDTPTEKRWFRLSITGIGTGESTRAIVQHENITGPKLAALEAQQQRQEVEDELTKIRAEVARQARLITIGEVAGNIAHELRNPLGSIRNAVYLMRRKLDQTHAEAVERYLSIVDKEIGAADQIIEDLMEMSRPKVTQTVEFDAFGLITESFERSGVGDNIELLTRIDHEGLRIRADRMQLRQVLINLISNAAHATYQDESRGAGPRRIEVRCRVQDEATVIEVADSGPGIPVKDLERAFSPAFTTKPKGTGLGLAICRQIVFQHGGDIEAFGHDDDLGGALLRITLPETVSPGRISAGAELESRGAS